ncbi:MAG: 2-oxo acid dehydrogenase subunit E2 [Deltaproteobacteria bacterium]|nr:2-oxo acid dehydrogenase subunit E2 [Deltaproteobacteria bacterium]
MEFKLPDIGEGIHEGEIVKWLVQEGDTIKENDPLVEVMTDKATVEIPSPQSGKIKKIHFKEGDVVEVDSVIVTFEGGVERQEKKVEPSQPVKPSPGHAALARDDKKNDKSAHVLATPAVRKLAKDLNVSLTSIKSTGSQNNVTAEDVKKAVGLGSSTHKGERFEALAIPKIGEEKRIPLKGIRKSIAHHLQMSKYYAPHFTHVEEVDVTELVKLRESHKKAFEKKGVKLTYLAYILKALIPSLKEFPYLNASLDETTQEIVFKKYFHVGVATDTPDGLVVPVVKDVDKKSLEEIAKEIVRLAEAVRANKAKPEELKNSSFTVTSIGSIGGLFATPILNYPNVAILAINKIHERPVVRNGKVVVRHMMYLAITLDHRVVDGAVAARFLNHFVKTLESPKTIK